MKEIGQFFDKFNSQALKELKKREVVCSAIKSVIGQDIPIEDVSFSHKIIKIKGSSALKSQILVKRTLLLGKISQKIPNISDIQ